MIDLDKVNKTVKTVGECYALTGPNDTFKFKAVMEVIMGFAGQIQPIEIEQKEGLIRIEVTADKGTVLIHLSKGSNAEVHFLKMDVDGRNIYSSFASVDALKKAMVKKMGLTTTKKAAK